MTRIRKILGSDAALWCLLLVSFLRTFNLGAYLTGAVVDPVDGELNVTGEVEVSSGIGIGCNAPTNAALAFGHNASAPITNGTDCVISADTTNGTVYVRNAANDMYFKVRAIMFVAYEQAAEPTLSDDGVMAIWKDTDDSNRIYLVYRRGSGDQVKVELT